MIDVKDELDTYLADFAEFEKATVGSPWARLREESIGYFREVGFPEPKNEEWRFTPLRALAGVPFRLAAADPNGPRSVDFPTLLAGTEYGSRIVFVNGNYSPDLSRFDVRHVSPLSAYLDRHPEWVADFLAHYAKCEQSPFTALNTAFLKDGALIALHVAERPRNPIHIVHISIAGSEPTVSHPRTLIVAQPGSQATIVETYVGPEDDVYFTNAVSEIAVGDNAILDHYKVQRESAEAFHIGTLQVHLGRASKFSSHSIALGGSLARNEVNAVLAGEGCECTLNGLVMAADRQLIDNHTRIDHAQPHCASHELYKHILDGQARGVFNGKIYVHPDAQKTDAKQTNQTLLLSEDAVMDTKPQLEIYADDVKCTHGATVGQIQEEAIFYLRSRGIGREAARKLLTFAFANDIVERIKVRPIRAQLEEILLIRQGLPVEEEEETR